MSVGEKFKEERLKQGYSLEAVEEETKIRKYYLEAIENENFMILPPKVYATGFVKRYAKFLGLNEQEMVEAFKSAAYGSEDFEEYNPTYATKQQNLVNFISWKNAIVAVVFLIIAIWVGNYLVAYFTKDSVDVPNHQNPSKTEEPNVDSKDNLNNNIKSPEVDGVEIVITANQNCWLNIVVDDVPQYNAILPAGEKLTFNGTDKIYLKAGNAGGISIIYNGKEVPPLGKIGEVKEVTYTSSNNNRI